MSKKLVPLAIILFSYIATAKESLKFHPTSTDLIFTFDRCNIVGANLEKSISVINSEYKIKNTLTCKKSGDIYNCVEKSESKKFNDVSFKTNLLNDGPEFGQSLLEIGGFKVIHFFRGRAVYQTRALRADFSGSFICFGEQVIK